MVFVEGKFVLDPPPLTDFWPRQTFFWDRIGIVGPKLTKEQDKDREEADKDTQ